MVAAHVHSDVRLDADAVLTFHRVTIIDDARTDVDADTLLTPASGNRIVFLGGFLSSDGASPQFGEIDQVSPSLIAIHLYVGATDSAPRIIPVTGHPWGFFAADVAVRLTTRRAGTQNADGVLFFAEVPA